MSTTVTRVDTEPTRAGRVRVAGATEPAIPGATEVAARPERANEPTPGPTGHPDPRRAHRRLVAALRGALAAVAELDPDLLGSGTPAGRAAVPMAGTARAAVAALGGDAGVALTHAPGVVVGRDLSAATSLLAAARPGDAPASVARQLTDLAGRAERHLAELLRVVTRSA